MGKSYNTDSKRLRILHRPSPAVNKSPAPPWTQTETVPLRSTAAWSPFNCHSEEDSSDDEDEEDTIPEIVPIHHNKQLEEVNIDALEEADLEDSEEANLKDSTEGLPAEHDEILQEASVSYSVPLDDMNTDLDIAAEVEIEHESEEDSNQLQDSILSEFDPLTQSQE